MISPIQATKYFENDIARLNKQFPRIGEVRRAVERQLARRPTSGEELFFKPGFWVLNTFKIGATPQFRVLYRFERKWPVILLAIDAVLETETPDG